MSLLFLYLAFHISASQLSYYFISSMIFGFFLPFWNEPWPVFPVLFVCLLIFSVFFCLHFCVFVLLLSFKWTWIFATVVFIPILACFCIPAFISFYFFDSFFVFLLHFAKQIFACFSFLAWSSFILMLFTMLYLTMILLSSCVPSFFLG